ncbi:hypothetical protein [Harryflintia acetispora]|nr:hypothetical protein [Harryflintia acetispora]
MQKNLTAIYCRVDGGGNHECGGDTKTNAGTLREHEETAAPFLLELV